MTSSKILLTILEKENKMQVFIFIAIILLFWGVAMNEIAVKENSCKMPVKSYYQFETDCHFSYNDSDNVKYKIFTDIIDVRFGTASIGDFFLLIGTIWLVIFAVFFIIFKIKQRKYFK